MLDARSHVVERKRRRDVGLRILASFVVVALLIAAVFVWRVVLPTASVTPASARRATTPTLPKLIEAVAPPEPEPQPEPQDITITLAMVGDVLMHDEVVASGVRDDGTRNYDHLFAPTSAELYGVDLALVNQETVLGGPDVAGGIKGFPLFNSPQEVGDSEIRAGLNVILKATNHSFDVGYQGLHSELAFWNLFYPTIPVIGASDPYGEFNGYVHDVYVYDKQGFKVAILNYTWATNQGVGALDDDCLSYLSPGKVEADVAHARELGAELIVACPHWGVEYGTAPSQEEHDYAHIFLEQGVDVVIGAHPHVLQPVEVLTREDGHRMLVYYSLGNFVSSQVSVDRVVGGMAKVWLVKSPDGWARVDSYELVPLVTYVAPGTNYTVYPLASFTDELADAIGRRGGLTPSAAHERCAFALGEGYDPATCMLAATMAAPPAPPAELMAHPTVPTPLAPTTPATPATPA